MRYTYLIIDNKETCKTLHEPLKRETSVGVVCWSGQVVGTWSLGAPLLHYRFPSLQFLLDDGIFPFLRVIFLQMLTNASRPTCVVGPVASMCQRMNQLDIGENASIAMTEK